MAYNLAALLLPALAAFCAYRLCLHLTGSAWASVFGGYLFGFSSFVLAQQLQGHLNLTGTFLLPLIVLAIVRFVQGTLTPRGLALRFGIMIAIQFAISTEITVTLTLALVLGILLALLLVGAARRRVLALVPPLAAGYGIAALLASPLVVYAILGFPRQGFSGAEISSTDLLDLVVPTTVNGAEGSSFPSLTAKFNEHESAIFLGVPLLLIVLLYAWRTRRSPWGRWLVVGLLLSLLLAIGEVLRVNSEEVVTLPWALVKHIPGFDNVHATRCRARRSPSRSSGPCGRRRLAGGSTAAPTRFHCFRRRRSCPAFWQPIFFPAPTTRRFRPLQIVHPAGRDAARVRGRPRR